MTSNTPFQFGQSQKSFDFNMPGKFDPLPPTPPPPHAEKHKGNEYVNFAHYESLEKRMEVVEHESKMAKIAQETLKKSHKNLEDAYHALQAVHQSANNRIRELELVNQDTNKKLEISKSLFDGVRAQIKAREQDLSACQDRLEVAETAERLLRSSNEEVLQEHKTKIEKDLSDEYYANMMAAVEKPPSTPLPPQLTPITTVAETIPVAGDAAKSPQLSPITTVVETTPVADDATRSPQLEQIHADILRGQKEMKWFVKSIWLLILVGVAAYLLAPGTSLDSPGALGFGWPEEDGYFARAHAVVFMKLIELTGGVTTYM